MLSEIVSEQLLSLPLVAAIRWLIVPDTWYRDQMSGSEHQAWSTLGTLLAEKNLTVVDLHEKLREQGFEVNKKSLYRLATSQPVQKIDTAIARAVCEALNVGLEDLIQFQKPRLELQRLNRRSEKELDRLMDNNNEGKLTEKQRARLKTLLDEVEKITLYNSKMLVDQKRRRESKHGKVLVAR
jgi:DNA-binding Xre family transcriptional regulator